MASPSLQEVCLVKFAEAIVKVSDNDEVQNGFITAMVKNAAYQDSEIKKQAGQVLQLDLNQQLLAKAVKHLEQLFHSQMEYKQCMSSLPPSKPLPDTPVLPHSLISSLALSPEFCGEKFPCASIKAPPNSGIAIPNTPPLVSAPSAFESVGTVGTFKRTHFSPSPCSPFSPLTTYRDIQGLPSNELLDPEEWMENVFFNADPPLLPHSNVVGTTSKKRKLSSQDPLVG
jgi:hypothetical protein